MWISQSEYRKLVDARVSARQDTQAAYDRLDQSLSENEKLVNELSKANERLEMMSVCVIDTLREALGMGEPNTPPAPIAERQEMPKEIEEAIQTTFPDDAVIQAANLKYAYSQAPRWESYAKEVADEIRQGA